MRVINLCHGAGNGADRACLMTASNILIGKEECGDEAICVCPVIRAFIIPTNDAIPEELLGELYGPLAWEIVGTRVNDPTIELQRAFAFADWAVRVVAPLALEALGQKDAASRLRGLAEINCLETANAAADAAHAASAVADIWHLCPEIIRKVAAIGDRRPVEVVMTPDQLAKRLSRM